MREEKRRRILANGLPARIFAAARAHVERTPGTGRPVPNHFEAEFAPSFGRQPDAPGDEPMRGGPLHRDRRRCGRRESNPQRYEF